MTALARNPAEEHCPHVGSTVWPPSTEPCFNALRVSALSFFGVLDKAIRRRWGLL
jgi:hypothetical protein